MAQEEVAAGAVTKAKAGVVSDAGVKGGDGGGSKGSAEGGNAGRGDKSAVVEADHEAESDETEAKEPRPNERWRPLESGPRQQSDRACAC